MWAGRRWRVSLYEYVKRDKIHIYTYRHVYICVCLRLSLLYRLLTYFNTCESLPNCSWIDFFFQIFTRFMYAFAWTWMRAPKEWMFESRLRAGKRRAPHPLLLFLLADSFPFAAKSKNFRSLLMDMLIGTITPVWPILGHIKNRDLHFKAASEAGLNFGRAHYVAKL